MTVPPDRSEAFTDACSALQQSKHVTLKTYTPSNGLVMTLDGHGYTER